MQEKLRQLCTTNDPFWIELNCLNPCHPHPLTDPVILENIIPNPEDEEDLDDSDVSLRDVIVETHQEPAPKRCGCISKQDNGGLATKTDAENIEKLPNPGPVEGGVEEEGGRGKQKKLPT